ncbi:MAG: hypothetical protein QM766_07230 [Burkholderiaceae bacterium]
MLRLLQVCKSRNDLRLSRPAGLDFNHDSAIAIWFRDPFQLVHRIERSLIDLENLTEDSFSLTRQIDQPWLITLSYEIERIPLLGQKQARQSFSLIRREVWETFFQRSEYENKLPHQTEPLAFEIVRNHRRGDRPTRLVSQYGLVEILLLRNLLSQSYYFRKISHPLLLTLS